MIPEPLRSGRLLVFALVTNGLAQGAIAIVTPLILWKGIGRIVRRGDVSPGVTLLFAAFLTASELARRGARVIERRHAKRLARAIGGSRARVRAIAAGPAAACGIGATIFLVPYAGFAAAIGVAAGAFALFALRRRPGDASRDRRGLATAEISIAAVPAVVLVVGGLQAAAGHADPGAAIAALIVSRRTASPLRRLTRAFLKRNRQPLPGRSGSRERA